MSRKLGGYIISEEIGRGGMAIVYRATQKSLDRTVAIKVLELSGAHAETTAIERFRLEARAAASPVHPD